MPRRCAIAIAYLILLAGQTSAAAPVFTEEAAQQQINELLRRPDCAVKIPMGEHGFITLEAQSGGSKQAFAQTVVILKDIGIIKIVDLPTMLGSVRFRVELSDAVDRSQIVGLGTANTCIKESSAPPITRLLKITSIKAGKTNWDGALVLATNTTRFTDLYRKYLTARRLPFQPERGLRYLFRYDPGKQTWALTAMDGGSIDGDFESRRLLDALRKD